MIIEKLIDKFGTRCGENVEFAISPQELREFLHKEVADFMKTEQTDENWALLSFDAMLFDNMFFEAMYDEEGLVEAVLDNKALSLMVLGAKCLDDDFAVSIDARTTLDNMKKLFDEKFMEAMEGIDDDVEDAMAELNGFISNPKGLIN